MTSVMFAAAGYLTAGVFGAVIGGAAPYLLQRVAKRRTAQPPPRRLVFLLVLVELRSGMSVLGALQRVSRSLPDDTDLEQVVRVSLVAGLAEAIEEGGARLRPLLLALLRAQHTGSSLTDTVRRLIENDIESERTDSVARARRLPIRLMIPVTLLMLPGLILVIYAPGLLAMFEELTGVFT